MRGMVLTICKVFVFLLASVLCLANVDDGLAVYKAGNYEAAIPLLKATLSRTSANPVIRAALLSALVYEGKVEDASDAADIDAAEFPDSPEVIAARGEFAYYMGDMDEAETLFKRAVKLKEDTPR